MDLYITEKPDQARKLADIIGTIKKENGFIETQQGIITWCYGHLLENYMPEDYNPAYKQWRIENLPIIPEPFKNKPVEDKKKQYKIITDLIKKTNRIIIASDPGPEGESIVREIICKTDYNGKIDRLWYNALDEESLKKALRSMRKGEETVNLYYSSLARNKADWLVGINLTQATTLQNKSAGLLSIGRVQTPTLAMIVRRDREIQNFKPEKYYIPEITADTGKETVKLRYVNQEDEYLSKEKAAAITDAVRNKSGMTCALNVETKEKRKTPPLLPYLGALQKECNKLFKWPANKTLQTAQALYENQAITYPRTDCQYLPEEQISEIETILKNTNFQGTPAIRKRDFNTQKITEHHAIIPTKKKIDILQLSQDEQKLYQLVTDHFHAIFMPDYVYNETTISTKIENHEFKTSGITPIDYGWQKIFKDEEIKADKIPNIKNGEKGKIIDIKAEEKTTKAPSFYTEATLLSDMENAAKFVTSPELKKILKGTEGIGTQATRAGIIETLKARNYIEILKGTQIRSTQKGYSLIELLEKCLPEITDPAETAIWEEKLEKIRTGKHFESEFVQDITEKLKKYIDTVLRTSNNAIAAIPKTINMRSPGKCPLCGSDIIETEKSFKCSKQSYNRETKQTAGCLFILWKEQKNLKNSICFTAVKNFLAGKAYKLKGINKEGNEYETEFRMEKSEWNGKTFWNVKPDFNKKD